MKGVEIVKSYLANAPESPGIYQMLDEDKNIIYIGKAKNIKNRLSQYTLKLSVKNTAMVALIRHIEYSITESESAALLLEGQLIKKFKPKFNILLKDDKSFPYIKLRMDHDYPQLLKFRGRNLTGGKFFGPFASAMQVDVTLSELQKIFKLRSCSDSYFTNRARPCLQYQIKRCYAPCVNKISKNEYDDLVRQAQAFLEGKNKKLQEMLSAKMEQLSADMKFEQAAEIRDRIKAISYVQLKSGGAHSLPDADVIALASHNGEFCVQLFIYRAHQPCGNQAYFPAHTERGESAGNVLSSFLMQLYQNKTPPKQILLSHEIDDIKMHEQALKKLHGNSVTISVPKHGGRHKIMENALRNAELALEKHLKISAKNTNALEAVQELFSLPELPRRIEVYDNSHIQGAFPVGAMVVAGKDGFEKKEYRLFNIKESDQTSHGGDDYAMLREVLTRRIKRLKSEPHRKPDLMIIDGGRGHMGVVMEVMAKLGTSLPFICMSKGALRNSGREQFHRPGHDTFTLDKNLDVMKYLQILRDEVHNFAIKSHRNKRAKSIRASSLDQIDGIGESRKKALLNYFGSFKAISGATISELKKIDGISDDLAKSIYEALRS
ncbi:MAG: excinuclease ABC subunit C [Rickettsiales bacterium]|nr:MAG: excinuclease ABC subunit C [Rickettsiales bacterium]